MNEWQQRFAHKLETVQSVARDRFEQKADEILTPIFKEYGGFVRQFVVQATTPLTDFGIRTYRFAMSEDVYLLMTFQHHGFEQCEAKVEYFMPGNPLSPSHHTVGLAEMNAHWCRSIFEKALDQFLDTLIDTMDGAKGAAVAAAAN